MSLPFFERLRTQFPQSIIDIIAKESIQEVYRYHPAIHTIYPFSKSRVKGLRGLFHYGKMLRAQKAYDAFFTLPPSFSSALIGYGVGSQFRLGYKTGARSFLLTHAVPVQTGIHRAYSYWNLLRKFQEISNIGQSPNSGEALNHHLQEIHFYFSPEEQQSRFFSPQSDNIHIVFNVNSEAQSRRLPLETWRALGNRLLSDKTRKIKIVFIGAASEQQRVKQVIQGIESQKDVIDFSGKTSLRELARLLRDADVVVSNDSGPMHLANAVGTSLVTWFGAGNSVETGPFNKHNAIIINKHLECSPCVKNTCKFSSVRCLEQISVDELYVSVLAAMKSSAKRDPVTDVH